MQVKIRIALQQIKQCHTLTLRSSIAEVGNEEADFHGRPSGLSRKAIAGITNGAAHFRHCLAAARSTDP